MSGGETSRILSELRIGGARLVPQASGSPAEAVKALDLADPVVLAVPRGGVTIDYAVTQVLGVPLEILLVRKIGIQNWRSRRRRFAAAGNRRDGGARS